MREKICDWCEGIIDVGEEVTEGDRVYHNECLDDYHKDVLDRLAKGTLPLCAHCSCYVTYEAATVHNGKHYHETCLNTVNQKI